MALPALRAGALPLQFLEYLVEEAVPAAVLHGSGVRVTVPQPARYAVHKLIVAQLRGHETAKRGKDLAQASAIMTALDAIDADALDDALDDARERGPRWRAHVQAGLAAIGLDRAVCFPTRWDPSLEVQAAFAEDCRAAGVDLGATADSTADPAPVSPR